MCEMCVHMSVCSSACVCEHAGVCVRVTHVEDGDDGRVIPADDGGHVLCLGDFGGDQLEVKNGRKRGTTEGGWEGGRGWEGKGENDGRDTFTSVPRVLHLN